MSFGDDTLDPVNEQERQLRADVVRMRTALEKIKAHHEELNKRVGRSVEYSHTIALCDEGLGG